MNTPTSKLELALALHRRGLSVIPLKPRSKDPAVPWSAFQTTSATVDQLQSWFTEHPDRNIGIALGSVSGVVAVDTDSPEAEAWVGENLPYTLMMTRTARGMHRYYRLPADGHELPAFIEVDGLKIELRRHGQYVVAPGSVHPSGFVYEMVEPWPNSLDDVPQLPTELIGQLAKRGAHEGPASPVRAIATGNRNNSLTAEAGRLRRLGFDVDEIRAALLEINRKRCAPPLPEVEVASIARSVARYAPATDAFPLTESGDAEFFAQCNADSVRYDHRRGRWVLFDGHIWAPQTDGEIHRLALDVIRARQRAAVTGNDKDRKKWALGGEARKRLSNMLALAQNMKPIADDGEHWDLDPWLLAATNGIVDLRTGTLRPGRPEDRITQRVRAAFDPSAVCPLFDQTVKEIFSDDADLIAYFDRYFGYSLTGDCREESLAFCWGNGANGKGTLMNTIGWLLDDYADDLPFSAFELAARSNIPNDIAKLVGKRYVTSSETAGTERLNEARVKSLTGRDPMTARFLNREFFTFQPVLKIWLATNQKPTVRDDSEGFWRRIHLIPFTASFIGREDKTLKDRLREEATGILARAVRGCLAWQREGLNPPDSVRAATKAYREESDVLAPFFSERCVLDPSARTQARVLFEAYESWCDAKRIPADKRLNLRVFGTKIKMQFQSEGGRSEGSRHVHYIGIGLRSEREDDLID